MSETVPALVVYTLRMERGKLDRLKLIADRENRTLAGEIRQMVDERIAREDAERAA
jgi:hypothetical protein